MSLMKRVLEEYAELVHPDDFEAQQQLMLDICEGRVKMNNEVNFTEPEEGDYTTEDHRHFYQFGKLVVTVPDDDGYDWRVFVSEHMEQEEYYPNVWFISDHGNAHLLTFAEFMEAEHD